MISNSIESARRLRGVETIVWRFVRERMGGGSEICGILELSCSWVGHQS